MEGFPPPSNTNPLCIYHWRKLYWISSKKIMPILALDNKFLWTIFYILIMTAIWPIMVLIISIPFGQFAFSKTIYIECIVGCKAKTKNLN